MHLNFRAFGESAHMGHDVGHLSEHEGKSEWRDQPADPPGKPLRKSTFHKAGMVVHLFHPEPNGLRSNKTEIKKIEVSDSVNGRFIIDEDGIADLIKLGQGLRMASHPDPEKVRGMRERLKELFIDRKNSQNRHPDPGLHAEFVKKIMLLFRNRK